MVHFKIDKFKIERDMLLIENGHKFSNELCSSSDKEYSSAFSVMTLEKCTGRVKSENYQWKRQRNML